MEDVKEGCKMYIKWMDTYKNTKVLTSHCCAGSGEEGVMEDVKEGCKMYIKWTDHTKTKKYLLLPAVVQVVVKKVSWRM